MPITFVSFFIDIYKNNVYDNRTIAWRFERFEDIAKTGINICVYTSPDYFKYVDTEKFPNVILYDAALLQIPCKTREPARSGDGLSELWIAQQSVGCGLPSMRNEVKDTAEYLTIMNSKTLFVVDAVKRNPFGTTHFAWIDFSLSYVLFDKENSLNYIKHLGQLTFIPKMLAIPGCWNYTYDNVNIDYITERICWRFCGGFFIGDAKSVLNFGNLYKTKYPEFIASHRKLVWEVNFWAWLETNSDWRPEWYSAGHDDTIITNLPVSYYNSPELSK